MMNIMDSKIIKYNQWLKMPLGGDNILIPNALNSSFFVSYINFYTWFLPPKLTNFLQNTVSSSLTPSKNINFSISLFTITSRPLRSSKLSYSFTYLPMLRANKSATALFYKISSSYGLTSLHPSTTLRMMLHKQIKAGFWSANFSYLQ